VGARVGRRERLVAEQRWDLPLQGGAALADGDRLESRHSMPGAEFLLRSSCVDQRSRGSKSTVGTGAESPMSAQDPAGSPSFGLLMTQPWCGPTPQTDDSPSSGLRRTRSAESTILSISLTSGIAARRTRSRRGRVEAVLNQPSGATRLRSDHQARSRRGRRRRRNQRRRHPGAPRVERQDGEVEQASPRPASDQSITPVMSSPEMNTCRAAVAMDEHRRPRPERSRRDRRLR